MARSATHFVCSDCGTAHAKWFGQCPSCDAWGTLVEERAPRRRRAVRAAAARAAPRPAGRRRARSGCARSARSRSPAWAPGSASSTASWAAGSCPARSSCSAARPASASPRSRAWCSATWSGAGREVVYVSGEESAAQIRLRHERLEQASCKALDVPVLAETDLDAVLAVIEAERPDVCVVDSVQTLHAAELTGAPGSVGQVREVAARIMEVAKRAGTAVVLVGHVTKEGSIAGPRVLEHLVDCVLQFEGERERTYRTLRALKNRFGSTARDRRLRDAPGRPGRGAGPERALRRRGHRQARQRRARGDGGLAPAARGGAGARVALASSCRRDACAPASTATASRSCSRSWAATPAWAWARADVFVNVVGGVRVDEPGADLAVALAVASAAARRRARRAEAAAGGLRRGRASRASCGRSATRSAASRRRRSSGWPTSCRRPPRARCARRCTTPCAAGARSGRPRPPRRRRPWPAGGRRGAPSRRSTPSCARSPRRA